MIRVVIVVLLYLLLFPRVVLAHDILGIVIALALVPLINIILAVVYSIIIRSGKQLLLHTSLAFVWIFQFWVFSYYTDSDLLAWLPLVVSVIHSLYLLYRSVRRLVITSSER